MLRSKHYKLRALRKSDDDFILALINQPAWKKYISNHSIQTKDQAQEYIEDKIMPMYESSGFGLWLVESIKDNTPLGINGLIKRPSLTHSDLGFAFLPQYWGKGIAYETSVSCLHYAFDSLKQAKVFAISTASNSRSLKLLDNLGFSYKENYSHPGSDEILSLYEIKDPNNL